MPVLNRTATHMATVGHNGTEHDDFGSFFECWIAEQDRYLQELVVVSRGQAASSSSSSSSSEQERVLRHLVNRVVQHYEEYYRAKSRWSKRDVLSMFAPPWRSSLEDAFLWIGGWRPSMAFHLLYSKSGLQLEARLAEILRGLNMGDLGDLSPTQIAVLDELQSKTISEEKHLTEKLAKLQETGADTSMVELSHIVTEMIREGESSSQINEEEQILSSKEDVLVNIMEKSDELRLRTLKDVINILTRIQAVHFLIAAAELHLRFHEWGMKKDAAHRIHTGATNNN